MRLLTEMLLSPITGPIRTAGFVVNLLKDQVEAEYLDEGKVRAELLDLTMRYDRGEIAEDEYAMEEVAILRHLNDIRAYKEEQLRDQSAAADEG